MFRRISNSKVCIMLTFSLVVAAIFPIYGVQGETMTNDTVSFETIIEKKDYEKVKVVNLETNETEYVETSYTDDGAIVSTITSDSNEEVTIIESNDEKMVVKKDGKTIQTYQEESFIENNESLKRNSDIGLFAYGKWSSANVVYGHRALWVGITAGALATIIAHLLGASVGGSLVAGAVANILADQLRDIWYKQSTQYRNDWSRLTYQGKRVTDLYKYNNYTGFIKSNTMYWTGSLQN